MKTALVIGKVWPESKSSAAGRRMMQLLAYLTRGYSVVFATTADINEHSDELAHLGVQSEKITLNDSSFDLWIQNLSPDLVVFDRFMTEEQFGWRVRERCPNSRTVLNTEDLHSLRHARQQAVLENRTFELSDLKSALFYRELGSILRCDKTLLVSHVELKLLEELLPSLKSALIHLPIFSEGQTVEYTNSTPRKHVVFIGNFLHAPNLDAVGELKRLWPEIRKSFPKVECHVYGAYCDDKAKRFHDEAVGFLVKGRAYDVHETLSNYLVLVAPIRFGAGVKGKFIDAMEVSTPILTTTIGSEGMISEGRFAGEVAEIADFPQILQAMLSSNDKFNHYKEMGKYVLQTLFSEEKFNQAMDTIFDSSSLDFQVLQSTMNHHRMASTKYLSRWIEEKNK